MCVMTDCADALESCTTSGKLEYNNSQSLEDSLCCLDEINQCPLFAMVQWVDLLLTLAPLFVCSDV